MMMTTMMNIYGKCLSWWLATYNAASQTPLAPIYSHHDDHDNLNDYDDDDNDDQDNDKDHDVNDEYNEKQHNL